jgi:CelD/BcsL family acetyltransferase involved in cellulose biosynthesis
MVRRAIECGIKHLDFLRGDEPYKTSWGAQPHAMRQVRVVPPTATNRVRRGLWMATDQVRHWWKKNLTAR